MQCLLELQETARKHAKQRNNEALSRSFCPPLPPLLIDDSFVKFESSYQDLLEAERLFMQAYEQLDFSQIDLSEEKQNFKYVP